MLRSLKSIGLVILLIGLLAVTVARAQAQTQKCYTYQGYRVCSIFHYPPRPGGAIFHTDYTVSQAGRAAYNAQASHCGAGWNWACSNAANPWPACRGTGSNAPGYPQYYCYGGFDEYEFAPVYDYKHCATVIGVGPYGGITNYSQNCY